MDTERNSYLTFDDAALLDQCEVDCYRARGPGGQKRNKTSSAVRLRHRPTGLSAIATEDRSQHVNKRRAVRRLRMAIALHVRSPVDRVHYQPSADLSSCLSCNSESRLHVGQRDARYPFVVGELLDLFAAYRASLRDTARQLGVSTANLAAFFRKNPKLWERVNQMRFAAGKKPLR